MLKKLICFVIVLCIVSPAMSVTRVFDNDGSDGLWATAANWNPDDKRPALTEDADIPAPFAVTANDPNLGCNILYTGYGSTLDITGGVLTSAGGLKAGGNFSMSGASTLNAGTWPMHGMESNTVTSFAMSGDCLYTHESVTRWGQADNSTVNATLSGNAHYSLKYRFELGTALNSTVNITVNDDAILGRKDAAGGGRWFMGGNNIAGGGSPTVAITMNDNSIGYTDHLFLGRDAGSVATLTMNDNCYVRCMNGTNIRHLYFGAMGSGQTATLNQNGGTLEVAHSALMPYFSDATCMWNLFGGVANLGAAGSGGDLIMSGNSLLNVKQGTLSMPGNQVAVCEGYRDAGHIKAYYGDYKNRATLFIDYDAVNDKTIISAYRANLDQAWGENPEDKGMFYGATRQTAAVTWNRADHGATGNTVTSHEVYFGAVKADVENDDNLNTLGTYRGAQAPTGGTDSVQSYIPGNDVTLNLGETWYWRIDSVSLGGTAKGNIWELNIDEFLTLDDMEAYDANDAAPTAIGSVWMVANGTVGVGYTYLAIDDSSMEVVGNAGGVTAVNRVSPIADLTDGGAVNHLRIYFHGVYNNSPQLLSVTLKDATGPTSFTVTYHGSATDIVGSKLDPFHEWAIGLDEFSSNGVDVTNIDEITIGCGNNTNKTYIDNIALYPTSCILSRTEGDVDGDCIITLSDFAILASQFLESGIVTIADDFESYGNTTALHLNWSDLYSADVRLKSDDAFEGSRCMDVHYDIPSFPVFPDASSIIAGNLPNINLSSGAYKELRFRIRRYPYNDPTEGVWIRFFQDVVDIGNIDNIACHYQISDIDQYPGIWEDVRIVLADMQYYGSGHTPDNGYNSIADLDNIVGIQIDSWSLEEAYEDYDIDYIRWMTPAPEADFDGDYDCDTDDLEIMGTYWLQEQLFPPLLSYYYARNLTPRDGATYVDPNIMLGWYPGVSALSHDVYFGTDFNDVNDANIVSDEYMGNQTSNSFDPNGSDPLDVNTICYWRIDEIDDTNTYKGNVWNFTTWLEGFVPGMVGWWQFEEGSGGSTVDLSGNDNDGTLINDPCWVAGKVGDWALEFDGVVDYIDLGNDNSLKPPLPVTLSAWIKLPVADTRRDIINLDDRSINHYGIWFRLNALDKLSVAFGDGGSPASENRRAKIATTSLSIDTWYHVAAVIKGATDMELYIDGTDDGGTYSGTGGSLAYSAGNSFIGSVGGSSGFFKGSIDDVMAFERALSTEEIQELYQRGLGD